jgi:hypothetical protein
MNLDNFNKGGNYKLQGRVFIFIEKFSMGQFNKGGNCKLQFPQIEEGRVTLQFLQMKFFLVIHTFPHIVWIRRNIMEGVKDHDSLKNTKKLMWGLLIIYQKLQIHNRHFNKVHFVMQCHSDFLRIFLICNK